MTNVDCARSLEQREQNVPLTPRQFPGGGSADSVSEYCSMSGSGRYAQARTTDPDLVAIAQCALAEDALAVDERPVARAEGPGSTTRRSGSP